MLTGEAAKLEAAEQSRKRIYARVSGALWQAGWCIWWTFFLPYITLFLVRLGAPKAMSLSLVVGATAAPCSYPIGIGGERG